MEQFDLAPYLNFILFVLGFGFIIFVHELGHFLVAKAVGIKVTQFAIGFGQALVCWRKGIGFKVGTTEPEFEKRIRAQLGVDADEDVDEMKVEEAREALDLGETEYRLNWMPLGGYVKMLGQDDMDAAAVSDHPRAFSAKPVWARAAVVSAGVIMNLIFALVFFFFAFNTGVEFPRAEVGRVVPGSPAALAYAEGHDGQSAYQGLRVGDHITVIDGEPTMDFVDVRISAALASPGHVLDMQVDRPGEPQPLTYRIAPKMNERTDFLSIGIEPAYSLTLIAAEEAGPLKPGMRLTVLDGKPIDAFYEYALRVEAAQGRTMVGTFTDPKSAETVKYDLAAEPSLITNADDTRHLLGLVPATRVVGLAPEGQSPARDAGMRAGDLIAKIGSVAWPNTTEVSEQVGKLAATQAGVVPVTVWRDGELIDIEPIKPLSGRIGIIQTSALNVSIVSRVLPGSPAADLRLTPGSRITAMNGQPVADWADMQRIAQHAQANGAETVDVTYQLNVAGEPDGEGAIALTTALAAARWTHPRLYFDADKVLIKGESFAGTVSLGMLKTKQFMLQTYITLARLFQGSVKPKHLHGPVGIVHVGTRMAGQGWTYLLFFLGLISVNLVVINFLPMPIVDGGLMVFLLIEKLKGSPVSPRVMGAVNIVGLVMLASIFLFVTYNDIMRLAQ